MARIEALAQFDLVRFDRYPGVVVPDAGTRVLDVLAKPCNHSGRLDVTADDPADVGGLDVSVEHTSVPRNDFDQGFPMAQPGAAHALHGRTAGLRRLLWCSSRAIPPAPM